MSDAIARAREVLAEATPGPWHAEDVGRVVSRHEPEGYEVADCMSYRCEEDARAVVLAMRALPALLALAEALTKHPPICLRRDLCEPVAPDARCPRCRQRAALDRALAALREAL